MAVQSLLWIVFLQIQPMSASSERVDYLIQRYAAGGCTAAELEELLETASSIDQREELTAALLSVWMNTDNKHLSPFNRDLIFQKMKLGEELPRIHTPKAANLLYRIAGWAAAIIIVVGAALYYFKTDERNLLPHDDASTEIFPADEQVKLTLASGRQLTLLPATQTVAGELSFSTANSQLSYGSDPAPEQHLLSTPKGKTFSVRLSDGSIVWLNATSSVSYPTRFTGTVRNITITGEAYLDIAPSKIPFEVNVRDQTKIQVLGTELDINAYEDEPAITTTLISGAVRVYKKDHSVILKPGQQSLLDREGKLTITDDADTGQVTAWKNGIFDFNNTGTRQVFRQLARWYDIEIEYRGSVRDRTFTGQIGRDLSLSQVLTGFEGMGLQFEMQTRKLIITQ